MASSLKIFKNATKETRRNLDQRAEEDLKGLLFFPKRNLVCKISKEGGKKDGIIFRNNLPEGTKCILKGA